MNLISRMKKIDLREQFIMAYGGLRGGVGFSLVKSISKEVLPMADTFVTTVLMLVMATVWIQGELWVIGGWSIGKHSMSRLHNKAAGEPPQRGQGD